MAYAFHSVREPYLLLDRASSYFMMLLCIQFEIGAYMYTSGHALWAWFEFGAYMHISGREPLPWFEFGMTCWTSRSMFDAGSYSVR